MYNSKSAKKLKVVLAGGGTGGHIYPAIAVAQKLKKDDEIEKIYYLGNPKNLEKQIVDKEGLDFLPVKVSGMPRKIGLPLIGWIIELKLAIIKSIIHFIKTKPDVILGTGGYVSGPALIAGWLLGIPFVIHDPDAHPGIVSRFMASKAKAVSISFESAKSYLRSKNMVLNGNPIRESFATTDKESALKYFGLDKSKKTLLVMGGSQGAKTINDAILQNIKDLVEKNDLQVIHQTGAKNFDDYIKELSKIWPEYKENKSYIVKPYFDDMSMPLSCADLAVTRAGSLSLSELNLCGLPSILVPYPYAAADHQRFNAKAMEKAGAAIYLEDSECENKLFEIILNMVHDVGKLNKMRQKNLEVAKPNSTSSLIKIVKEESKVRNKGMITTVIALCIIAMLSIYLKNNIAVDNDIIEFSTSEVKQQVLSKNYMIIDVREEIEFNSGHIPNSKNLPLSKLKKEYKKLPKDKYIILVCRSGNRSLKALSFLKDQGFDNLVNYKDGITDWEKFDNEIEKPSVNLELSY